MERRYSREEMRRNWSEASKFEYWLLVELAILKARQIIKEMPCSVPNHLERLIIINPDEINRLENSGLGHDVIAFLTHVSPQFPEELRPWLHKGVTSYDIVDTALSLQLRASVRILIKDIEELMEVLEVLSQKYKYAPEIGRTHGVHAEPITFGVKTANWYDEMKRNLKRLQGLFSTVSVGKVSGAVGMFTLNPRIEEIVCDILDLKPIIATQIISRDIIAEYQAILGVVAASVAKISVNVRLLSQTEVAEVREYFGEKQKGSSAMPHKRNPVKTENVSGVLRVVWGNAQTAYQNLADCWYERSIDNSGPERIILPDSSAYLDYEIARMTSILKTMEVLPYEMEQNLHLTKGLVFSQEVLILLASKSGLPREEAHTLVRDAALQCWKSQEDFLTILLGKEEIMRHVKEKELCSCFDLAHKLRFVDHIFDRVFGKA